MSSENFAHEGPEEIMPQAGGGSSGSSSGSGRDESSLPLLEDLLATDPLLKEPVVERAKAAVKVRAATGKDLPVINEIYNHYVLNSTATYQTEPETMKARETWFASHDGIRHPVLVAEVDGKVVGWGSLSRFHARAAYRHTVEDSVYVHHEHQGEGIGSALLEQLVRRAGEAKHKSIIAIISADQKVSIKLHEKFDFETVGRLKEVGKKFGKWLDVVYMQRMI